MTAITDRWFRKLHAERPGSTRVLVLPHAGGAAVGYRTLSAALSRTHDVLVVQYPGRQDRWSEPHFASLTGLAEQIVDAVGGLGGGPLALFGHSMGATVAFEVARRLDAEPTALFVSGRRAPTVPDDRRLGDVDDDELIAELRAMGGTDPALLGNREMRELIVETVRNDYRAVDSYAYRPAGTLRCPVVAMAAVDDERATVEHMRPWGEVTTGPFELHTFTGGHFFVDERVADVARIVGDVLTR